MQSTNDRRLVLYSFPWSICSIMVRYAFACRGDPRDPNEAIELDVNDINIMKGEQFTEHYLCDVNGNGEVPVLIEANGTPLPDSVEITFYLAKFYPSLAPEQYKTEIESLLKKLHTISFFALTFTGKPENQHKAKQFLNDSLQEDLSPRYREAIQYKLKRIDSTRLASLTDDQVNASIERAKTVMQEVDGILQKTDTDWCFGLKNPSALDAHLVVFVARMLDLKRGSLIPDRVQQYAVKAMAGEAWKTTMQGRSTLPPGV